MHQSADIPAVATTKPASDALLRILDVLGRATTLRELMGPELGECAAAFGVAQARVMVFDEDLATASIVGAYPTPAERPAPVAISSDPSLKQILETHEPLYVADTQQADLAPELLEWAAKHDLRTIWLAPLLAQGRILGALEFSAPATPRPLSAEELLLARMLAGQLGVAIANIQLIESTERRNAEIATLNDIAATVTSTLDPREVYRLVVQKINEYFRVEAGSLLLVDQQTNELVFVMTLEAGEEKAAGLGRVPPGHGLVGEAIRTRQPVIVNDAANDPRVYRRVAAEAGFVDHSSLSVPMLVQGRSIGVIQLLNKLEGDFNAEDAARLSAMANTIAVAIYNASLFQDISQGRNRLQAILNSTEDAILMIDTTGVVVTANPRIEQLFGMPWEMLPGQKGADVLAQLEDLMQPIPSEGTTPNAENIADFEVIKPHPGFVRRVELPVYSSNDEQIGHLIIFHDITEERELTRLRDDYTNMLIHDLRSPLMSIMNGMMMVRRGFAGEVNDQQRELLDISNNSSKSMLGLINQMLDISKMEAGQMSLKLEPCSIYDIVEQAKDIVIASARSVNIDLILDVPVGLPIIEADQDKLIRVLQNLLDNAIKFTPPHGSVRLQVRLFDTGSERPMVQWSVIDTGPGIPEAYRSKIFDKFIQVKGTAKGTGIGLSFAKLATEAHGGNIWVDSVEGEGSTFSFTTPYKPA